MKKRKLDINQIKKITLRGRQARTITTKYEVVLSFFKKKDNQPNPTSTSTSSNTIFTVTLQPLVSDLLEHLANAEILYKLDNELKGEISSVKVVGECLDIGIGCLGNVCKEFPVKEIMECLEFRKDDGSKKVSVVVDSGKLMVFFKHLRAIFPEFCYSTGEKTIIDANDLKAFYETFKCEWNKIYEKGRIENCQKMQKLLCRSLYFLGALIENNIFNQIAQQQRLKRQQKADISTKSQKKSKLKLLTHQVSSTYSFGGEVDLMSNMSSGMMSQKSNQESFCKTGGFSEKSERLGRRDRGCRLWDRAQIKETKIVVVPEEIPEKDRQNYSYQIDLLSNDVQNILIQQAFKIQRFKYQSSRFSPLQNTQYPYSQAPYNPNLNYYHNNNNNNQQYYQNYYTPLIYTQPLNTLMLEDGGGSGRTGHNNRIGSHTNLVSTRKTHSRLQNKKDYH